jgi:hypothetical protein
LVRVKKIDGMFYWLVDYKWAATMSSADTRAEAVASARREAEGMFKLYYRPQGYGYDDGSWRD